jgi:ribosomal protein S18 acetylase RimI-like enzyme
MRVYRASLSEVAEATQIIDEYYTMIGPILRDNQNQLKKYFDANAGVWLALDGTNTVGCIALWPLTARPLSCEVKRLYVRPSHRGIGIADMLMDALEAYALLQGYRFAYLDTREDLQAAVRFYERRGYKACERFNDNPHATISMQRRLG